MKTLKMVAAFLLLQAWPPIQASAAEQELGKWWKDSEIVRRLELSQGQIDRIEQNFLHFRPTLASLVAELKDRESELEEMLREEPPDDAKIQSQMDLVTRSRAALEKANSSMMLAIRKELTLDQWNSLGEIQQSRRSPLLTLAPTYRSAPIRARDSDAKVYAAGPSVTAPKLLYHPMPAYTQAARDAKIEGLVILQVTFRKDGTVDSFKVLRGLGYGLDESAISAVATKWRFEPGRKDGEPVDVRATVEFSFRLY